MSHFTGGVSEQGDIYAKRLFPKDGVRRVVAPCLALGFFG